MIALREARPADEQWINDRYRSIGFHTSDLAQELVLIAEVDGVAAGMGRLVPAGEDAFELGGMHVLAEYRGRGLARRIIDELLRRAAGKSVYCIPFAELEPIYAAAGFVRTEASAEDPPYVHEKLEWCAREIPERAVILMKHVGPAAGRP